MESHERCLSMSSIVVWINDPLTSLENTKSNDVRVDHAQVERREVRIGIRESDEHRVVHDGSTTLVNLTGGLVGKTFVGASNGQVSVGHVQLVDPSDVLRLTGLGVGNVAVVGTDGQTGAVPGQVNLLASKGQRLRAVVSNARTTAVARNIEVNARLIGRNVSGGGVGGTVANTLPIGSVVGVDTVDVGLVAN